MDVVADGRDLTISPYPGTRARRVREVRYMYKWKAFHPSQFRPGVKEEGAPVYGNDEQGWVDNGVAGIWLATSKIRAVRCARKIAKLTQCIGCHSGIVATEFPQFTSGTGNTVDSTWRCRAVPRRTGMAGDGLSTLFRPSGPRRRTDARHPPIGRPTEPRTEQGEFRHFLDNVVGVSL